MLVLVTSLKCRLQCTLQVHISKSNEMFRCNVKNCNQYSCIAYGLNHIKSRTKSQCSNQHLQYNVSPWLSFKPRQPQGNQSLFHCLKAVGINMTCLFVCKLVTWKWPKQIACERHGSPIPPPGSCALGCPGQPPGFWTQVRTQTQAEGSLIWFEYFLS